MSVEIARKISVRRIGEEDRPLLEAMYDTFIPHGLAHGLPPREPAQRRDWLASLRAGINLAAFADATLAGHLALMPCNGDVELTCFVHQDFRRQGIAWALAEAAVGEARAAGFTAIWVLIDNPNIPARRGLIQFGFRAEWEDISEAKYVYDL